MKTGVFFLFIKAVNTYHKSKTKITNQVNPGQTYQNKEEKSVCFYSSEIITDYI